MKSSIPVALLAAMAGAFLLLCVTIVVAVLLPLYFWLAHGELSLPWLIGGALYLFALVPALLPMRDCHAAPGPELRAADHPVFFEMLHALCADLGQRPPDRVFLLPDNDAYVTHRGGFLGIGCERVLALGLPLLAGISRAELLALLAHEMGHFHHGDFRWGAWIYRLREAMARAVGQLQARGGPLYVPMRQCFLRFLRLSQAHARQQELHADALAARTVGPATAERALRRIANLGSAWDAYLGALYEPIIESGKAPPLLAGFDAYVRSPEIERALDHADALGIRETTGHPFDSHPSVFDRVRAFRAMQGISPRFTPTGRALEVFDGAKLQQALAAMLDPDLQTIEWDEVAREVLVPHWAESLAGLENVDELPRFDQLPSLLGEAATSNEQDSPQLEQAQMAALLVLVLAGIGNRYEPASGVQFRVRGEYHDATRVLRSLGSGRLRAAVWSDLLRRAGLAGRRINQTTEYAPAPLPADPPLEATVSQSRRAALTGPGAWLAAVGLVLGGVTWLSQRANLLDGMALTATLIVAGGLILAGSLRIFFTPALSRARLRVDGDQLWLSRRGQERVLPLDQIRNLRCWLRESNHQRYWHLVLDDGDGRRYRFAHGGVDDGSFGALCNRLLTANRDRVEAQFDRGEAIAVDARAWLRAEGLEVAGHTISWNDLAQPRIMDGTISVFRIEDRDPCLILPPDAPDQHAIASLIARQTVTEDVTAAEGTRIHAGWNPSLGLREQLLLGALIGMPLLALSQPALWRIVAALALLCAYPLIRALSTRIHVHERAVVERSLFGTYTLPTEQITSVRQEGPQTLIVNGEGRARPIRIRIPRALPDSFELTLKIVCHQLVRRWLTELRSEGQVHWCESSWIRTDDIADAQTQLSLPMDADLRIVHSRTDVLLYARADPEAVIRLPLNAVNLHVGQLLIECLLDSEHSDQGDQGDESAHLEPAPHHEPDRQAGQQIEAPFDLADALVQLQGRWTAAPPAARAVSLIQSYPMPDFLADHPCPVQQVYTQRDQLANGSVVWGAVVQAHGDLYEADNTEARLAAVVYAEGGIDAEALQAIAERLYLIKGRLMRLEYSTDQRFADLLEDESEQQMRLRVPPGIVTDACENIGQPGNAACFYTTCVIHPDQLPTGHLQQQLVPLLIAPRQTAATLILPKDYWPPAVRAWWSPSASRVPASVQAPAG